MSNKIKTKLNTIDANLDKIKQEVLAGKRKIAYALKQNGYETVNPYDDNSSIYDTFTRYADLILRLRNKNSFIMEFTFPETARTAYKRTLVLPMEFSSAGCPTTSLNNIAREVIAADRASQTTTTATRSAMGRMAVAMTTEQHAEMAGYPMVEDDLGNKCIDGNYTISIDDMAKLNETQKNEFIDAAIELGQTVSADDEISEYSNDEGIALFSNEVAVQAADNSEAVYNYTVDWGDGTTATYIDGGTYEENKAAIWHTYEKTGVYDVSINGNFRILQTRGHWNGQFVYNGEFVRDTDNAILTETWNNGMINYLTSIIAWGNTLFTKCESGLRYTQKLESVPMYDTTNSFADVSDFSYMFGWSGIKSLPYNASTKKGLFSGCEKATNMYYLFYGCTNLTDELPDAIIDGCINLANIGGIFGECNKLTGSFPATLFKGLSNVTQANNIFNYCSSLNGELPNDLFSDCKNITTIAEAFKGCTGLKGTISKTFLNGLSSCNDLRQAFYNCGNITGIEAGAFDGFTKNNILFNETFYGTGIKEIPEGLFEGLKGRNHSMFRMFSMCNKLTKISETAFTSLKIRNAYGMFGSCTSLQCKVSSNEDWNSYRTIKKWYGAFGNVSGITIDGAECPFELNGIGTRKYAQGNVGKIVLQDETLVEPKDYVYDASNKPIGVVNSDVYIDPAKTNALNVNGKGNVVEDGTEGAEHILCAMVLNDSGTQWVDLQTHVEDITFITNTSDISVGYNRLEYASDGVTQNLPQLRYCGREYDRAIAQWCVEKGYASNMTGGTYTSYAYNVSADTLVSSDTTKLYFKRAADFESSHKYEAYANAVRKEEYDMILDDVQSTRYLAMSLCHNYSDGIAKGKCYLPDGAELWDAYGLRDLLIAVYAKIIAGDNSHTSSNTFTIRQGTVYWSSVEDSAYGAWNCRAGGAYLYSYDTKWKWHYVRPAFALHLSA